MTGQQNVSKTYFLFQMVLAITAISSTMKKSCVVDSVDAEIREEYFDNLTHLLNGRELDYIVVNHMEPDHCQTLLETLERYPNCKMVGNATTFRMFEQFYNTPKTRTIPSN